MPKLMVLMDFHDSPPALEQFISHLLETPRHAQTIVSSQELAARMGESEDFPEGLHPYLNALLLRMGISRLYKHQAEAIRRVFAGKNIVISTGVSSGKSMAYWLPILQEIVSGGKAKALLLYPTKALEQDQMQKLGGMCTALVAAGSRRIQSAIYDGDTPPGLRSKIRRNADIIASNPDMLHLGILPNHPLWSSFISCLRFVVIDEIHYYRGVMGSHFANVIRRLKRICRVYGVKPIFICTSATLGNARELAGNILEDEVEEIFEDSSRQGARHYMIVNPPIVERDLGIRRSSMMESVSLARIGLKHDLQSILFSVTRPSVEMIYLAMSEKEKPFIAAYRSGYLADERRKIERDLREGRLKMVISTNALELGIDIGGLDLAIINGYPGSIAAVRQEAGRAGRKGRRGVAILVAGSNPLDQYICNHPEYLWESNPEQALIDPDNTEILLRQLDCAVCELALREGESFGRMPYIELLGYLELLMKEGKIRKVGNKFMSISGRYPAQDVSIRNASGVYPILCEGRVIGSVDADSAHWMTHPNAIYLHSSETYIVQKLDLEKGLVEVRPLEADYYTRALRESELEVEKLVWSRNLDWGKKHFGEVKVHSRVSGFKKIRFGSMEVLGTDDLDLPVQILHTKAWWISLSEVCVHQIREQGLWNSGSADYGKGWRKLTEAIRMRDAYRCVNCGAKENGRAWDVHHKVPLRMFKDILAANDPQNLVTLCPRCHHLAEQRVQVQSGIAGLGYLIHNLAPFFVMCASTDLGLHFEAESELCGGNPVIALYDMIPGGIGLSQKLYDIQQQIFAAAYERVQSCRCESGCPACVGPVAEMGEGAKAHAAAILEQISGN
jgi:DEAD/DEAH box helicase domain-containing protein